MTLRTLLLDRGLAVTSREAREYCHQGLIFLNEEKKEDPDEQIKVKTGDILRRGKYKEVRIP